MVRETGYVSYFACNSDSIISKPFPLKIRDSNKTREGRTNRLMDQWTDRQALI